MPDGSFGRETPAGARALPADVAFLVAEGFRPDYLARTADEARRLGVCAHELMIAASHISPRGYARALAARLGLPFVDPRAGRLGPAWTALADAGRPATRVLPVEIDDAPTAVIAPVGREVEQLLARQSWPIGAPLALTAPTLADAAVLEQGRRGLSRLIARLADRSPALCARDTPGRVLAAGVLVAALAAIIFNLVAVGLGLLALTAAAIFSVALFGLGVWVRLLALATPPRPQRPPPLRDAELPPATVLAPLYHEAHLAADLVAALLALDYPASKRQLIVLVEADDPETAAAVRRADLLERVDIVAVPDCGPRGKPRALQIGLLLARGDIITVYDAEDVPAPGQLRAAAGAFAAGSLELACVQAPLVIRPGESFFERQFALEYAALFGRLVPALARANLPVLLGGTSNHFRTKVLRGVGGWDPWNVTEDADLGVRLARAGYRVGVIAPPTVEEAPDDVRSWLGQRRRWFKGWLQTALLLAAQPRALLRDLGLRRTAALVGLLFGTLGAALLYPFAFLLIAFSCSLAPPTDPLGVAVLFLSVVVFFAGNVAPLLLLHRGGIDAGLKPTIADLLAALFGYWALASWAAWGAVGALIARPFHWVKTTHRGREADLQGSPTGSPTGSGRSSPRPSRRAAAAGVRG